MTTDEASSRDQVGQGGLGAVHRAEEVHVHDAADDVEPGYREPAAMAHAGVVHQHVERPEALDRPGDCHRACPGVGDVARQGRHAAPTPVEFRGEAV